MNALDLLVDFTTLISTSVESMPNEDENSNDYIGSSHDTAAPSLASEYPLPFRQYHSTRQTPKETVPRSFAADPPSRDVVSPSTSYVPECRMANNEHQRISPSFIQHDDRTSYVFNTYLQENHSVGPSSSLTSVPPQPWFQQSEPPSQWAMHYEADPTLTSVSAPWYNAQTPRAFGPPQQHQTASYQDIQIPCPNPPSQCWTQTPQGPYSSTWLPWVASEAPYDRDFLTQYNEWTIPSTSGTKTSTG
ncbi:hypothetical protein yc1106_06147 [Curvularia clavata]|uniref:Uncharacterized protein n=1 Tax=Curvularia clavata TaxID=95742 RepID=A0A9Q8ZES2_CURCL|nr:hypothetical protein yc1106_06147 [Curvularia clavata]